MSKTIARNEKSRKNEGLVLAFVPAILISEGFQAAAIRRSGGMKFIDARDNHGRIITFWVKQAWSTTPKYAAVQFGMFDKASEPSSLPDSAFIDYVADLASRAQKRGARYALFVHEFGGQIQDFIAFEISDVARAYARQIEGWAKLARNTRSPTLYFADSRDRSDMGYVDVVEEYSVPVRMLSGVPPEDGSETGGRGARRVTADIDRRCQQQAFRLRVGARCDWRCVLSGVSIREVLDAAHLPDRDWRVDNDAADGVLLRADLHRLLDQGLAEIRGDRFMIQERARTGEYAEFHGKLITPEAPQ